MSELQKLKDRLFKTGSAKNVHVDAVPGADPEEIAREINSVLDQLSNNNIEHNMTSECLTDVTKVTLMY